MNFDSIQVCFFFVHIRKIKNNFKDTANSSKLVIRIEPREEYTNAKSMSMTILLIFFVVFFVQYQTSSYRI